LLFYNLHLRETAINKQFGFRYVAAVVRREKHYSFAISSGVRSDVINHASPTSCIHVPMYEATDAIHSARKIGMRSGAQADVSSLEWLPTGSSVGDVVLLAEFAIAV